ncbi:hypothetical protein LSUB1_G007799, partial [Lachnellula subtilissima]
STMAPTSISISTRTLHQLTKRKKNWAAREAGVIVVFCIVFLVASGLIGLFLSRLISRKRAEKASRRSSV